MSNMNGTLPLNVQPTSQRGSLRLPYLETANPRFTRPRYRNTPGLRKAASYLGVVGFGARRDPPRFTEPPILRC